MVSSYSIAPGSSSEDIAHRRKMAALLLQRSMNDAPIQHPMQGVGRMAEALVGGLQLRKLSEEDKAERAAGIKMRADWLNNLPAGGTNPIPPGVTPTQPQAPAAPSGVPMASAPGKVYSPDEPSPLDPPSGKDRDMLIRTVYGEAANEGPVGQSAVANVVRNRAVSGQYGGDTIPGVALAKNQFEPWNRADATARMLALSPEDPRYKNIGATVDAAYTGANDPTNGAVNFYAPKAQAALGRSAPKWDDGSGTDIGNHRFFGGKPADPAAAATAPSTALAFNGQPNAATDAPMPGMAPKPAAATVAQAPAAPVAASAQPGGVNREALAKMLNNRYTAPMAQAIIAKQLENQFKPSEYDIKNNPDGSVIAVDKRNPQNIQVITPPGANERALKFETDKALATKKAGEVGEAEGKATVALPEAITAANDALKVIQKAKTHPGIDRGTGIMGSMWSAPGSAAKDFDVLNTQLRGKAFVQAFEKLKGGGAISEKEGEAATAAIARLDQSQSKEAYLEALGELEGIVQLGIRNAQIKAGNAPTASAAPRTDTEALKKKYGLQ